MNILVIGSTGPQGREFIAQALGAGHAVRALARNPSALQSAPSLEVVRGDVFDPPSLDAAVHGEDAAVVILVALHSDCDWLIIARSEFWQVGGVDGESDGSGDAGLSCDEAGFFER